ncbi:MAG: hypothetical protein HKN93_10800 [Acidimicrobiia bacterium]|nr:hypothetical protein [Acidimicrobiia bacterium]
MFRLVVAALAIVGLTSLFFGAGAATAAGIGLLAIPLILAKVFFFMLIFGFIARGAFGHRSRRGPWQAQRRQGPPWTWQQSPRGPRPESRSREDDFDEWHRMSHARKEVDDWAPPVI